MEIFELIWGGMQLCGCLLEIGAAFTGGAAGVQTARYVKARNEGVSTGGMKVRMWMLWILGILLLFLVFLRWIARIA